MYVEPLSNGKFKFVQTYKDIRTGKNRRVSVTLDKNTSATRREAQRYLEEMIVRKTDLQPQYRISLKEVGERYLSANRPNWAAATQRRNASNLRTLCRILGGQTKIDTLTARYVRTAFDASGRANVTKNEDLSRFKSMMTWAYKNDYIEDVTWLQKIDFWPEPSLREKDYEKYLEKDELIALIPEMTVTINRLVILFLALSGLRIGEALSLYRSDVDLKARQIHVTKTMDHKYFTPLEQVKTDASYRDVFIQDELLDLCKEINAYQSQAMMQCGFRTKFFFSDLQGDPVKYARICQYFGDKTETVIGRRLTPHSLRHTHASLMFEAGVSVEAVSARLGHADTKVTREIYLHVTKKKKEQFDEEFRNVRLLQNQA